MGLLDLFRTPAAPVPQKRDQLHPLLQMKKERDRMRKQGVGIVFSPEGFPRVTQDWVRNLTPEQREWADKTILEKGYRINAEDNVERIP